jgi:hypothetical protein
MTRYNPLLLKLFPDPATRPRQREVLIEFYRKGKVGEALRTFKKIYLNVIHQLIDNLGSQAVANITTGGPSLPYPKTLLSSFSQKMATGSV